MTPTGLLVAVLAVVAVAVAVAAVVAVGQDSDDVIASDQAAVLAGPGSDDPADNESDEGPSTTEPEPSVVEVEIAGSETDRPPAPGGTEAGDSSDAGDSPESSTSSDTDGSDGSDGSTEPADGSAPTTAPAPAPTTRTTPSSTTTTTTTTPAPTTAPAPAPLGNPVLAVDFDTTPVGPYTDADIRADWPAIKYTQVYDRVEIVSEGGNRFVRVRYPRGGVGPRQGGAQWQVELEDRSADELYVAYRVRFVGSGFDYVRGGKLPGLSGGTDNTGGERPSGTDGWSGRVMWRPDGQAVQYLYHPDQPGIYGEDLRWNTSFAPNQWHTVETRIKMNTPGQRDGIVQSWMDGQMVLNRTDIRFRDTGAFNIDSFLFSTFFGGSGSDWAPTKNEVIDFDDFIISASPITH